MKRASKTTSAPRIGRIAKSRPETFPAIFVSKIGDAIYVATLEPHVPVLKGDTSQHWRIFRVGNGESKPVGRMHESNAYGWGYPTCTMRELVWSGGGMPPGDSSPKSPFYGWGFDLGPRDEEGYQVALDAFAKHAERLVQWRAENAGKGTR